jgi:hypothetical protein
MKLVGCCFDGAANMSGKFNGLQAKIKSELSSMAIYVHCHAHKLNLAVQSASNAINSVRNSLDLAEKLHNFVQGSTKRAALFRHIQDKATQTTLKQLSETRWHSRFNAFKALSKSYSAIISLLTVSF